MPHKRAKRSTREETRKQKGSNLAPSKSEGISSESIPKSALRVLQAAQIRADHAKRKRENPDEDDGRSGKRRKQEGTAGKGQGQVKTAAKVKGAAAEGKGKGEMKILPGESLAHFNRRVEDGMRGDVRAAMQSSSAHGRKARKQEEEAAAATKAANIAKNTAKSQKRQNTVTEEDDEDASLPVDKHANRPKEFAKLQTSAPHNVNDIALAPPTLALKKATKLQAAAGPEGLRGGKAAGVLSMAQRAMMEVERERAIKHYRELKEKKYAEAHARRESASG
ncbi:hypothetical protein PENSPDRAFT_646602 [Peniophora sp. CONT]|nr:hypothetical protein PENSPDRAFT_646602 [Peniophora sp. CONT]